MHTRTLVVVSGAVMALSAVAARADFIRELGTGTFAVVSEDPNFRHLTTDLTVLSEIGGWGVLSFSTDMTQTFQAGPDLLSGTAIFQGANPVDQIVLSISGLLDGIDGQPNFSYSGLWETTSAGGVYAGLYGSGDFSGSAYYTSADGGLVDGVFQGDLVPTPGAASLLALAGLAACRRRRA